MTTTLVLEQHLRVIAWVAPRVGEWVERLIPGIGIGVERDGRLIAGVVFNRITNTSADVHVALTSAHAASKALLRLTFDYAFRQLALRRLTAYVREDNTACRRLVQHMGFTLEGLMRHVCTDGTNVLVYGMLREDCRWAKP